MPRTADPVEDDAADLQIVPECIEPMDDGGCRHRLPAGVDDKDGREPKLSRDVRRRTAPSGGTVEKAHDTFANDKVGIVRRLR